MAGEVGFDMKIRVTEFATGLKQGGGGRLSGLSCSPGAAARIPTAIAIRSPPAWPPLDYSAYCNADVDAALVEARTATDLAVRKAAYDRAVKTIRGDDPVIYLFHRRILIAHTARLEGYRQMPDGLVRVVGLTLMTVDER